MSYILEALRKSERQRREIEEQPLVRLNAVPVKERSRWRIAIVVLSALTNVVVLAYLVVPVVFPHRPVSSSDSAPARRTDAPVADRSKDIRPDQPVLTGDSPAAATEPEVNMATPHEPPRSVKPKPAPSSFGSKITPPSRVAKAVVKESLRQRAAIPTGERRPGVAASAADSPPPMITAPVPHPPPAVPERSRPTQAPEPLDAGLPQPKINVYAYTARVDGDRFVIIHNRKYREGDRIEEGPVVRRIEEHGMTLEFAGQTYKIPRP